MKKHGQTLKAREEQLGGCGGSSKNPPPSFTHSCDGQEGKGRAGQGRAASQKPAGLLTSARHWKARCWPWKLMVFTPTVQGNWSKPCLRLQKSLSPHAGRITQTDNLDL